MTACSEFTDALGRGDAPSSEARAHLATCDACRALAAVDRALARVPVTEMPAKIPTRLRAALAAEPPLVVVRAPRFEATTAVFAALALPAMVLIVAPRPDFHSLAPATFWGIAAALWALFAGAWALVVRRGPFGLGVSARTRWLYAILAITAFEGIVWCTAPFETHALWHIGLRAWGAHVGCALWGSLIAVAMAAVLARVARHRAITSPVSTGALTGAAAGFVGILGLHACCGFPDALHLALVHAVPVVLGTAVGAQLGRRVQVA